MPTALPLPPAQALADCPLDDVAQARARTSPLRWAATALLASWVVKLFLG